jgi:uncharacterized protein (DUF305 family)
MKFNTGSFLLGCLLSALLMSVAAFAEQMQPMAHDAMSAGTPPVALPVDKTHTFAELMANAEQVMHFGMAHAPRDGDPDHDFASGMIPHHQGAIDMAKVELLYGKDPVLRRMAQEIIVSQQQEIVVMQGRVDALQAASNEHSQKDH